MDAALKRAIYQSLVQEIVESCSSCIREHKGAVDTKTFSRSIKIARKLVQNLIAHPTDEKFRRLQTSKRALRETFFDHSSGISLLKCIGFIPSDEEGLYQFQLGKTTLSEAEYLMGVLSVFRSVPIAVTSKRPQTTEQTLAAVKPEAVKARLLKTEAEGSRPKVNDHVSKPNPVIVHARSEKNYNDEKSTEEKVAVPGKKKGNLRCQLNIRFASGRTVTKSYMGNDKVKKVWDFVSPEVRYPYFELKPMGMGLESITEDDLDKTLVEMNLCPASRVVVQTLGGPSRQGRVDVRDVREGYVDVSELDYEQMLELEEQVGKVKKHVVPVDKIDTVGELTRWEMSEEDIEKKEIVSDEMMCAICRCEFKTGDELRVLPCNHKYHRKCVDYWLTECRDICPECTQKVKT